MAKHVLVLAKQETARTQIGSYLPQSTQLPKKPLKQKASCAQTSRIIAAQRDIFGAMAFNCAKKHILRWIVEANVKGKGNNGR
jgi:hypothetical protein